MKASKFPLALLLTVVASVLTRASQGAELPNPKEAQSQSYETQRQQGSTKAQKRPADRSPIIQQVPQSPSERTAADNQGPQKETNSVPHSDSSWWFNLFVAVFTGCLVLVGVGQIVVYWKQAELMRTGLKIAEVTANAARDANNIDRESLETTHRARLDIENVHLYRTNDQPWVDYQLVNNGRLPATGAISSVMPRVGIDPPWYIVTPEMLPPLPPEGSGSIINSSCSDKFSFPLVEASSEFDHVRLTSQEWNDAISGKQKCQVSIYALYWDGFNHRRISQVLYLSRFPDSRWEEQLRRID